MAVIVQKEDKTIKGTMCERERGGGGQNLFARKERTKLKYKISIKDTTFIFSF